MNELKHGLKIRVSKKGVKSANWVAANCSRKAKGYPRPVVRLHGPEEGWAETCKALHADLLEWIAQQDLPVVARRFDGTISGLIDQYTGHKLSPYHKVKHSTRKSYDWVHGVLKKTVGKRVLAKVTGLDFISWAEKFANAAPGKVDRRVARAHDLMSGVRRVFGWGVVLELPHAKRLNDIIGELRFEEPRSRVALFTYEMAKAIIDEANARNRSSIAMAQALQLETVFRQIDVIGEWVDDMGRSGIRNNVKNTVQPKLWTTGMTWGDISPDLILSTTASKTAKTTRASPSFDLKLLPLVSAEIAKVPREKRFGPLVVNEKTGLPYTQGTFNNVWREIATAAGVPLSIQNRDSRSGGITEGTDAGANLELMRGAAGHSNPSTTARYSRRTLEKTNQVADLRNNWRENKGKNKT